VETEIDGVKYRSERKLTAFEQFHVFRKMAPLISGMGETFIQLPPDWLTALTTGNYPPGFWQALEPVAMAIAQMSKEDSEFVIRTSLVTCLRQNSNGSWAKLTTPTGDFMFEDIDLMVMLQLTVAVVMDNLGRFFTAPLPQVSGNGATASAG
jgi:hypothetical protein